MPGKRDSAGLWVDFEEAWALAAGLQPSPTCKRSWTGAGGHRRDFVIGCPLAAALLFCRVQPDRWIAPHLAIRALFDCDGWESWVTQSVQRTPLWPASWLPVLDKTRSSMSAEVQRVWEVYDERLQFMSRRDASLLDESLGRDDVSLAWLVWSRAAEAALADAFRFSGGPLPSRGLVLGKGSALLRVVKLGGHRVRKARANDADALDAADVFLYYDSSVAPLLDMRRRFKAVMDVLDAMILYGVSLSRSVELTVQWDRILVAGPLYRVGGGGIGFGRIPYRWLRPDLVPPAPFLQCEPHLTPDGSGVLSDPVRIDEEFRKAWLPYFCRSGQRETSLDEFSFEVDGWLPLLPEVHSSPVDWSDAC